MVSALPFTQSTRKYAPTLPADFWIAGLTFSVTSRTQRSRASWEPDQSVVLTSITTLLSSHLISREDIMRGLSGASTLIVASGLPGAQPADGTVHRVEHRPNHRVPGIVPHDGGPAQELLLRARPPHERHRDLVGRERDDGRRLKVKHRSGPEVCFNRPKGGRADDSRAVGGARGAGGRPLVGQPLVLDAHPGFLGIPEGGHRQPDHFEPRSQGRRPRLRLPRAYQRDPDLGRFEGHPE